MKETRSKTQVSYADLTKHSLNVIQTWAEFMRINARTKTFSFTNFLLPFLLCTTNFLDNIFAVRSAEYIVIRTGKMFRSSELSEQWPNMI